MFLNENECENERMKETQENPSLQTKESRVLENDDFYFFLEIITFLKEKSEASE
jgi:hypothetical protein